MLDPRVREPVDYVRLPIDRRRREAVMRGLIAITLTWSVLFPTRSLPPHLESTQGAAAARTEDALPKDVHPDSRNRLPPIQRDELDDRGRRAYDEALKGVGALGTSQAAALIRLHRSGANVRWESPVGRALTELAILTTAREHDQPYEWSLHEMEAIAVGLDPTVIDVVRHRKSLNKIGDKEITIIQAGREIFGRHKLSSETYARGLKLFGRRDLVDILDLMAVYSATAARLSAFNQHMPPGWKQFLPLSFTQPNDIHADSRSRLPLMRSQGQTQQTPSLYSRGLAPEGTGPGQLARHGAGLKSLEASVGPRLMGLAILVTAREHDAQYQWTINEPAAIQAGLEPAVVDIVRHRRSVNDLAERDAVVVEFGRELFDTHNVSPELYARGLKAFGERDLVDLVGLMAQHSSEAALFAAFDQHLPEGQKPLLPIP
jgi:4-carboxymuconolactone decarboxylase